MAEVEGHARCRHRSHIVWTLDNACASEAIGRHSAQEREPDRWMVTGTTAEHREALAGFRVFGSR